MEKRISFLKLFGWNNFLPSNKMYSCEEAAEFLNLPRHVVYALRRSGVLPFTEFHSMYFFNEKVLLNWIIQNQPERVNTNDLERKNLFKEVKHYLNIIVMIFK